MARTKVAHWEQQQQRSLFSIFCSFSLQWMIWSGKRVHLELHEGQSVKVSDLKTNASVNDTNPHGDRLYPWTCFTELHPQTHSFIACCGTTKITWNWNKLNKRAAFPHGSSGRTDLKTIPLPLSVNLWPLGLRPTTSPVPEHRRSLL